MGAKVNFFVKVNNTTSGCFFSHVGLKQEEILSPLPFALFLDDLELYLMGNNSSGLNIGDINILLLLFADDMAVLSDDPVDLQTS